GRLTLSPDAAVRRRHRYRIEIETAAVKLHVAPGQIVPRASLRRTGLRFQTEARLGDMLLQKEVPTRVGARRRAVHPARIDDVEAEEIDIGADRSAKQRPFARVTQPSSLAVGGPLRLHR